MIHDRLLASVESNSADETVLLLWVISVAAVVAVVTLVWCCRFNGADMIQRWVDHRTNGRVMSDIAYANSVSARRAAEAERKLETPDERRKKLLAYFKRKEVQMVIGENDFVQGASQPVSPDIESNISSTNPSDISTSATYIAVNTGEDGARIITNCCAVCLCGYEEGEVAVWSSEPECQHVFHQECIIEWLIKMQEGTPCPCCRQEFTKLDEEDAPRKNKKCEYPAFDVRSITL